MGKGARKRRKKGHRAGSVRRSKLPREAPGADGERGAPDQRRLSRSALMWPALAMVVALSAVLLWAQRPQAETESAPVAAEVKSSDDDGARSHALMVAELRDIVARTDRENFWLGNAELLRKRKRHGQLGTDAPAGERWRSHLEVGLAELRLGNEVEALEHLQSAYDLLPGITAELPPGWAELTIFELGMAHMRRGETLNCSARHTGESCILPIRGAGIHQDRSGSERAIERFVEVLKRTETGSTLNLKARWALNLAAMTLGDYPGKVPAQYLIPPEVYRSEQSFPRFANVAPALGVDSFNLYGAAIVDDFTGDGYFDILTTTFDVEDTMHLFRNQRDGTFADVAEAANLGDLYGGINAVQADYDNDGDLDFYVLRGAWLRQYGLHPNSLVRNNGDGTFTDVTFAAGLANERFPTQTGAWADYDNDGFVDLYVGNEHSQAQSAPSHLYRNNGDGTFTEVGAKAGVTNMRYVKGVVWGDYDGDRFPDLYTSTMGGPNRLYRNNGDGTFTDRAEELGVTRPHESFPIWFWDVNNDGHLDLFVSSYLGDKDAVALVAASYLGLGIDFEMPHLYLGDGEGGFTEAGRQYALDRLSLPMGANFGDLDSDGHLDFYLGTGYPDFEALMPNVMYRNVDGKRFTDVTYNGGFGHLQKGHSVAFADLDNDGDQDIFEQMGGIFPGDRFSDALFVNPGFGNHWLSVTLEGVETNRAAIGARLKAVLEEGGRERTVYRHVTSGGSFGSNPLRQLIGLGKASRVVELEVSWPTSSTTQVFTGLDMDSHIKIVEGRDVVQRLTLEPLSLSP